MEWLCQASDLRALTAQSIKCEVDDEIAELERSGKSGSNGIFGAASVIDPSVQV